MPFIAILNILWPIAALITPALIGAGILWLRSQFATKAELEAVKADLPARMTALGKEVDNRLNAHAERFERGSAKFADHDKRIALVEADCKEVPTRQNLQAELSQISQRLRGVETGFEGMERQLNTTNDYLKIIVDKGFKG